MKRIINFAIIAAAALLAFAGCVKEQGYDTDQYGSAPTLSAFAPNPVFRGGELTFLGSNLEQVTSVKVPGVDEITAITVEATGRKSRIKITLPNSTEEVGVVKLTCKDGTVLAAPEELSGLIGNWTNMAKIVIGEKWVLGLKRDGTVVSAGIDGKTPPDVSAWSDIMDLVTGKDYCVGVRSSGNLVFAGDYRF